MTHLRQGLFDCYFRFSHMMAGFDDILLNFDESAAVGSIKSRLC
jgi:hypothetical protein